MVIIKIPFMGLILTMQNKLIAFGQLTYSKKINDKHDFLLGFAYRYTFYDDNTFATLDSNGIENNPSKIHLPGIFLQDEIAILTDRK